MFPFENQHRRLEIPTIFNLRSLFKCPPEGPGQVGFRRGSTILISGRPGVGKSFFALSLVREQILALGDGSKSELLYVGVGLAEGHLARRYEPFGWFADGGARPFIHNTIAVDETDLPKPTRGAEELINPILTKLRNHVTRPDSRGRRNVFVVFDSITALVKGSPTPGDRQRHIHELVSLTREHLDDRKALCVMITESPNAADPMSRPEEESSADFVFYLDFREAGGGRLARVLDVRKCPEHTPLLLGRHSWEILHPYNLGEVIAPPALQDEIRQRCQQDGTKPWGVVAVIPHLRLPDIGELQDEGWEPRREPTPNRTVDVTRRISCGVPGLDEMLRGDRDYWARPTRQGLSETIPDAEDTAWNDRGGLILGTTTFLIGRAGTGKTNCGLQFLLANPQPEQCLYVNFENRPHRIRHWYPGSEGQKARLKNCRRLYLRLSQLDINLLVNEIHWMVRKWDIERVVFDGLSDLASVLDSRQFELLIEELIVSVREAKFEANKAGGGAESKLVSIYVTLETEPDGDRGLEYEQQDSPADNVVVFRQVTINDERRKTVEVRKARGQAPDRQLRELLVWTGNRHPLRVVPGLDNYRRLADGRPEPVRVALQLIGENPTEVRCNLRLTDRLRALFGYNVTAFGFSRGEIIRTLLDIASGTDRIPFSDAKLLHVDEWWIRELRVKAFRQPDETLAQTRHPLLRLNPFLVTDPLPGGPPRPHFDPLASDFWAVEMEKVCVPVVTSPQESAGTAGAAFRADVVALPSYADFGLFCLNRKVADGDADRSWREWLNDVPRVWARATTIPPLGGNGTASWWYEPPTAAAPTTVVDYMARTVTPHAWADDPDARIGFAFDMETPVTTGCSFLELCWAFGATEDSLVRDVAAWYTATGIDQEEYLDRHPATRALGFLLFLVAEGLMPPRTTLRDASRALFSRLWYSSIPDIDEAARPPLPPEPTPGPPGPAGGQAWPPAGLSPVQPESTVEHRTRTGKMFLCPLPFFPLGAFWESPPGGVPTPVLVCLQDAISRFDRLLRRVEAAITYRRDLGPPTDPGDGSEPEFEQSARATAVALRAARAALEDPMVAGPMEAWNWCEGWRGRTPDGVAADPARVSRIVDHLDAAGATVQATVLHSPLFALGRGYERTHDGSTPAGFNPMCLTAEDPASRNWLHLPYAMFVDVRDVLELLRWHDFRLAAIRAALAGRPLGDLIHGPGGPARDPSRPAGIEAVSGFACEGAWMVGADRTTRSPNLSAKFLDEIASLASTEERAWLGAGIPARKDFYDLHGQRPVPCLPHPELTWNRFLTYAGSRARRRTRTFCARVRVSAAFDEIDRRVFHCLTLTAELRPQYRAAAAGSPEKAELVRVLTAAARDAARGLFRWIAAEMADGEARDGAAVGAAHPPHRHCVLCPTPGPCQTTFEARSPAGGGL